MGSARMPIRASSCGSRATCVRPAQLDELALVHGEPAAQQALRSALLNAGFASVRTPRPGDVWEL
jgi:hypothetical protein